MDKNKILTIVGAVGVVGGTIALVLGGHGSAEITPIVEGVVVVVGLVAALFGLKKTAK